MADLANRSGGNMLFLREIVMGAVTAGALRDDGGVWRLVSELHPSDRLVELVEARLAGLDSDERALMEAVSFGEPLGSAELGALGSGGLAEGLERKGLLVSRIDGRRLTIALAHPLYGEVLRARIPALRARSIARALAESVEATGARRREDVLRIGHMRLLGGGGGPDLMLDAARAARWHHDFALAERLARAAAMAGAGFAADLLLAQVAALQGRSAEAGLMLAGLAHTARVDEHRALVALARLDNRIIYEGSIEEGLAVAEQAGRTLPGNPWSDEIRARHVALVLATEGPRAAVAMAEPLLAGATGRALVWACMPGSYSMARTGRIGEALVAARRGRAAQLELTTPMDWYPAMHRFYEAEALTHAGGSPRRSGWRRSSTARRWSSTRWRHRPCSPGSWSRASPTAATSTTPCIVRTRPSRSIGSSGGRSSSSSACCTRRSRWPWAGGPSKRPRHSAVTTSWTSARASSWVSTCTWPAAGWRSRRVTSVRVPGGSGRRRRRARRSATWSAPPRHGTTSPAPDGRRRPRARWPNWHRSSRGR